MADVEVPALPWEAPRQGPTGVADFNSPGDFIQQVSNFQFQVNATRIIFSTLPNVRDVLTH
jgi:hypothetical protein